MKYKYNSIRTTSNVKVQTIQTLIIHFRRPAFRLHSADGDALGLLAGRGLGIGDGQNAILHRRLDIPRLQTHGKILQKKLPTARIQGREETRCLP